MSEIEEGGSWRRRKGDGGGEKKSKPQRKQNRWLTTCIQWCADMEICICIIVSIKRWDSSAPLPDMLLIREMNLLKGKYKRKADYDCLRMHWNKLTRTCKWASSILVKIVSPRRVSWRRGRSRKTRSNPRNVLLPHQLHTRDCIFLQMTLKSFIIASICLLPLTRPVW